ncbi:MAG: hypothetical protein LBR98_04550 [Syntrophomonadaceae bacterium]|jgi:hypothetical protein|nr:hypothetical protein [Syntrophomonadaceae bacterium]
MEQAQRILFKEISKLPLEKVDKALSFIRYLEQEPDTELFLEPAEEAELRALLASGDTVDAGELLPRIKGLPNDFYRQSGRVSK